MLQETDFFAVRLVSRYHIRSLILQVKRCGTKMNLGGELDQVEWNGQELAFFIADDEGWSASSWTAACGRPT